MGVISAGRKHGLIVGLSGEVYVFGSGSTGQLGLGDFNNRTTPTVIPNLPPIKSVMAIFDRTYFLTEQGDVYFCGGNIDNPLRLSNSSNRISIPERVPDLPRIRTLSTGGSLFIDENGGVWALGDNLASRLGLPNETSGNRLIPPTLIPNLPPIKAVSHGSRHSLYLDYNGTVYASGIGQLGLGNQTQASVPTPIPNLPRIIQIAAGYNHSVILDEQGRVYAFGYNQYHQLGIPDRTDEENRLIIDHPTILPGIPRIVKISASGKHTLILDESGKVYVFGSAEDGQAGQYYESPFISEPLQIPTLSNIVEISAGETVNLALNNEGVVYSFGRNDYGQLGLGYTSNIEPPRIIPNIRAKLPSSDESVTSSEVFISYPILEQLLNQNTPLDYTIRSNQDQDTLMEFIFPDGSTYLAQVQHDPQTDQINAPSQNVEDLYFDQLEGLIRNNQLNEFQVRSDLYSDSLGNQGFEFINSSGQHYLIRVYLDDQGQIYRPISN